MRVIKQTTVSTKRAILPLKIKAIITDTLVTKGIK